MKVDLAVSLEKSTDDTISYKQAWGKIMSSDLSKFGHENINWDYSSSDLNVEQMWSELYAKLQSFNAIVPTTAVHSNGRPVKLPWDSSTLKRLRINKDKAWTAFDVAQTIENFNYAMNREQIYDDEHIKLKINYEKKITANLKDKCK